MHELTLKIGPTEATVDYGPLQAVAEGRKFVDNATQKPCKEKGLFPPVVRSYSRDARCYLVERSPFVAHIQFRYGENIDEYTSGGRMVKEHAATPEEVQSYDLPIPWTLYAVELSKDYSFVEGLRVYFSPEQIYSESDFVYSSCVPNVEPDGEVCLGTLGLQKLVRNSISETISDVINGFWDSRFNNELSSFWLRSQNFISPGDPGAVGDRVVFKEWEKLSIGDVLDHKRFHSWDIYRHFRNIGIIREGREEKFVTVGDIVEAFIRPEESAPKPATSADQEDRDDEEKITMSNKLLLWCR